MTFLDSAMERVATAEPMRICGRVASLRGLSMLVSDLPAPVGQIVSIEARAGAVLGEVVGFDGAHAIVMTMGSSGGVRRGDQVVTAASPPSIGAGDGLLGRVVDALGRSCDHAPEPDDLTPRTLSPPPIGAMERARITEPLPTGVRALDLFTTLGRGQRLGLFAGPGVGKSTLLAMIARRAQSDVNVIALIGERGREVRDFVESALGPEGLARSVVVVSTSEESPLMRVRAASAACAIAEHFRDRGKHVMLMVDSITRFAHAQRQIGLASGEPPATRGYTPSVFAALPVLLERAGAVEGRSGAPGGSITGVYTVLVEGDDMTEPIADATRGILDGHVMLSRTLAQRGHFPAIDVLDSVSRLAEDITDDAHKAARRTLVSLLAAYAEVEELVQIGAYARGSNAKADAAIELRPRIEELLTQSVEEGEAFDSAVSRLVQLSEVGAALVSGAQGAARRRGGEA